MGRPGLTSYPLGSLKELSYLSLPLVLSLFSSYLCFFFDRVFLSHYSIQALQACAVAGGLLLIFQRFCIHMASMTQAFVAQYKGAGQKALAGQFTWQMIWFSLLSSIVIIPLGLVISHWFFRNCEVREQAQTYFSYLLYGNCLLALECTLTSFYAGIGKTRLIFWFHLISHGLNIGLNGILIFGITGWISPLGLHGAAIGTLVSKLVASLCFGIHFVKKYRGTDYQIEKAGFNWKLLKEGLSKGLPRSLAIVMVLLQWNAIAYFMMDSGGDYLLALSIGTSLFLPFFSEAISQGTTVVTSYLIGRKSLQHLWKVVRASLTLNGIGLMVVAIPLLIFPKEILSFFFPQVPATAHEMLIQVCRWVWLLYFFNCVYLVVFSLAMSYKETFFFLKMNVFGMFIWAYLPVYYAFKVCRAAPEIFWLLVAIQPLFPAVILLVMLFRKHFRQMLAKGLVTS